MTGEGPRAPVGGGFGAGFRAMIPLWLGVVPFALAYAVTARGAGLSILDTQLMSSLVFAGGAQFSAAGLFAVGAGAVSLVVTTFLINARHVLYSLSLGQTMRLTWVQRGVAAFFLTDEAFGVTVARGGATFPFLLGAELSLYLVWNAATFAGSLASAAVPDPAALGVDFIFPLAFLALLVPLLRGWPELGVAGLAGALALVTAPWLNSGMAILVAGTVGALVGAWFTAGRRGSGPGGPDGDDPPATEPAATEPATEPAAAAAGPAAPGSKRSRSAGDAAAAEGGPE